MAGSSGVERIGDRRVGTAGAERAAKVIAARLGAAGWDVSVQPFPACRGVEGMILRWVLPWVPVRAWRAAFVAAGATTGVLTALLPLSVVSLIDREVSPVVFLYAVLWSVPLSAAYHILFRSVGRNVVARRRGEGEEGRVYLLAHYDSFVWFWLHAPLAGMMRLGQAIGWGWLEKATAQAVMVSGVGGTVYALVVILPWLVLPSMVWWHVASALGVPPWVWSLGVMVMARLYMAPMPIGTGGANDNATGVEVLLRVAERLGRDGNASAPAVLVFTDAEEVGTQGAAFFARSVGREGVFVAVDMVGVGEPHAVLPRRAVPRLERLGRVLPVVERGSLVWQTDAAVARSGWGGVVIGLTDGRLSCYHAGDRFDERVWAKWSGNLSRCEKALVDWLGMVQAD